MKILKLNIKIKMIIIIYMLMKLHLYVNEVTFKLQSQYLFKELFINDMKSLGFHIVIVTEFIKDEIKNLIFQNKKEIKELIIEKESQIISNSDNISDKLFNTIKKNNNKSKNERNSIIKFELSKSYSIPIEKIDENFVKIYNDKKLIKIFFNLNNYNNNLKIKNVLKRKELIEDSSNHSLLKDPPTKIEISINLVFFFTGLNDIIKCIGIKKNREEIEKLINDAILNLLKNSTQIEILFGKSYLNYELLNKTTKDKLSFINSITDQVFGLKWMSSNSKKKGDSFIFTLNKNFEIINNEICLKNYLSDDNNEICIKNN